MHFSLGLLASIAAGLQLVTATPAAAPGYLQTRADNGACAKAAQASSAYLKAYPSAKLPFIPAEILYNCLKSVPLKKDPAVALVRSLKPYAQIQSSIDYLRNPPSGYLWDPVDIPRLLDAIETKLISKDTYESEYDFQLDLQSTFIRGKDGHMSFNGDLVNAFGWIRPFNFSLVSLSSDGKQIPQIYHAQEILDITTTTVTLKKNVKASAIKSINGMDAETFLLADSNGEFGQDPDHNWNTRYFRIQAKSLRRSSGGWHVPAFYPGPTTTIEYQNGTKITLNNVAIPATTDALTGITNGEDMYKKFCTPKDGDDDEDSDSASTKGSDWKRDIFNLVERQTTTTSTSTMYPKPVISDPSGVLSGYYLADDDDVAVLAVYSFLPGSGTRKDMDAYQLTAQTFFADAVKKGKTKLVIDLQGNGGGSLDLSIDLIAQLFPDVPPNSKDNMRASWGMYGIMLAASNLAAEADGLDARSDAVIDDHVVPFAYQEVMTPEVTNFNRLSDYYGPAHIGNGLFTNFFQGNYTNDSPSQYGLPGIVITGTNNRKGFKQPFKAENIIMLTDGVCASACTIFSEHLKQQGVQVIALGGRPQTGPMQAVGGTKGSQVFHAVNLKIMLALFKNGTLNTDLSKSKGTIWDNFSLLPLQRSDATVGLNGRNQFRIGDTTQTPLQFVYEAADCRIFYTPEMAASPTPIWSRVASLAFDNRKNGIIDSPFCVQDSTKHATSLSGGLKKGSIGPQTPPANAKSKVKGFLINGKDIVTTLASGKVDDKSAVDASVATHTEDGQLDAEVVQATETMATVCGAYKGSEWFVQLLCAAFTKQSGNS